MRFGLIGCGGIGQIRAEAIHASGDLKLAAVADVDLARAEAVARPSRARVDADWRKMLGSAEVDAVIVSTPPSLHAEMCIEALRAGKHVMCEKPLARTPEECRRMVDAAETAGRVLATGFNYRFYPSVAKAREILDSGLIGDLDHIRSYSGYTAADHSHPWIHDPGVTGGGALSDNGIHLLDLTRWFLGEVEDVRGAATNGVWHFKGCEDNGFAMLRNVQGRVATVHASWTEWWGYRFRIEVYGSRGCVRLSCFPMITEVAWCDKPGAPVRRQRHLFPKVHLMEHLKSYKWIVMRSFIDELRAFAGTTRGERTPVATGFDGLRTVEIAASVSASML